jgi:hypothetical protein
MTVPADKAPTCIRFISPPDTAAPMQLTLPRCDVKVEITPLPGVFHYYFRDGFRFLYRVPSAQTAVVIYQNGFRRSEGERRVKDSKKIEAPATPQKKKSKKDKASNKAKPRDARAGKKKNAQKKKNGSSKK